MLSILFKGVTLNPRRSSASEHRNQEHDFPAASIYK